MLIDTHAHLNFSAYKNDVSEVIKRTLDNDVWMINVGSQYSTSKRAVEIAGKYERGVYAAVGLHPIHVCEEEFYYEEYKELAKSSKVVAIGEIGFDYWYRPKTNVRLEQFKQRQKEAFEKQLELAEELNLPIIFHCRVAHEDLINILNTRYSIQNTKLKGVIHCFTGTWEEAKKYLDMGFHLGFNGIVFKLDLDEVIEKTPLEQMVVETDCPYLTPPPMARRNEPLYVKYVAEKIAKIKNIRAKRTLFSSSPSFSLRENSVFEEISEITAENAKKLFNLI